MEMLIFIIYAVIYFPPVSVMAVVAAVAVVFLPVRIALNRANPGWLSITAGCVGLLGLVVWPFVGLATARTGQEEAQNLVAIVYAWPLAVAFWLVLMFWAKSVNERVQ